MLLVDLESKVVHGRLGHSVSGKRTCTGHRLRTKRTGGDDELFLRFWGFGEQFVEGLEENDWAQGVDLEVSLEVGDALGQSGAIVANTCGQVNRTSR